jgi:hypothetical protein
VFGSYGNIPPVANFLEDIPRFTEEQRGGFKFPVCIGYQSMYRFVKGHNLVLPSISVSRNVSVPVGRAVSDTRRFSFNVFDL